MTAISCYWLIDWFCDVYGDQDLFASCHNVAMSLYNSMNEEIERRQGVVMARVYCKWDCKLPPHTGNRLQVTTGTIGWITATVCSGSLAIILHTDACRWERVGTSLQQLLALTITIKLNDVCPKQSLDKHNCVPSKQNQTAAILDKRHHMARCPHFCLQRTLPITQHIHTLVQSIHVALSNAISETSTHSVLHTTNLCFSNDLLG